MHSKKNHSTFTIKGTFITTFCLAAQLFSCNMLIDKNGQCIPENRSVSYPQIRLHHSETCPQIKRWFRQDPETSQCLRACFRHLLSISEVGDSFEHEAPPIDSISKGSVLFEPEPSNEMDPPLVILGNEARSNTAPCRIIWQLIVFLYGYVRPMPNPTAANTNSHKQTHLKPASKTKV